MTRLLIVIPDFWAGFLALLIAEIVILILVVGIDAWKNRP